MINFEEDPLERSLDAESDLDFGTSEFENEALQDLKNWSAQDFSNIYVRYFPHLLRHAKRYLSNHSQAEEVVQDAFLYLMTSLPEIDSEVGVLKLLKWKVRLLALDVIKSNSRASFTPVDELELVAKDTELDQSLIRADEAAIISLALAKLNPRQREAIISSVYQEKETFEVAEQLGLSENATRQLLFRARSAFKKALVGEAEIAGLSISQILSVAARKAAQDASKYVGAASALLVVLAISIGVLPNLGPASEAPLAQIPAPTISSENTGAESRNTENLENAPEALLVPETAAEVPPVSLDEAPQQAQASDEVNLETPTGPSAETPLPAQDAGTVADLAPASSQNEIRTASLSPYLNLSVQQAEVVKQGTKFFPNSTNVIKIHSGVGLWAYVDLDPGSLSINAVAFEVMVDGKQYFGSARSFGTATSQSEFGYTLTYSATEIFLIDEERNVLADHDLANAFATIAVQLDNSGEPILANLFIKSK